MHPGSTSGGHSGHQRLRFYIVMITLVVGGVLFLLLLNNNNPNGFSLTSAIVGETNLSKVSTDDAVSESAGTTQQKINKVFSEEVTKNGKEVPMLLTFDQIPSVKKDTKVEEIELYFDDLTTTINVNDDKLELNNMKEVKLTLKDFSGSIAFSEEGMGLKGTANRIEVNDVAFSSEKTLSINLNNLHYRKFDLRGITLKEIDFPSGSGALTVSDKLTYTLEDETVRIYSFRGRFSASKEGNVTAATTLEGTMQGIGISGQELGINVW
ncbi:hypothetical protein HYT55_00445 [Candidatus Woesearchaeota archaeon]|nr:hypothetical protein [Candidatus Woesearchaeota archaeon]